MISGKAVNNFQTLQSDILRLQGFKSSGNCNLDLGLGPLLNAFPNRTFPLGAIHEFVSAGAESEASSCGFIAGLLSCLMGNSEAAGTSGTTLWISSSRTLFPPALKNFGIIPDRFIFVDLKNDKEVIWAMDEALKCGALNAVVGEMKEISFTASRRLQLAVEQSQVTGFVLRRNLLKLNTTACVSRWKITSLPCDPIEELPGIGFPKWRVELLRIRNGKPGAWDIEWSGGKFVTATGNDVMVKEKHLERHKQAG